MAKYDVTCPVCDITYRVALFGPQKDRNWKLDNFDWTCDACREKLFRERCQRESEAAAAANAETGLPVLEGSEKQIAWAESIRAEILKEAKIPEESDFLTAMEKLETSGRLEEAERQARLEGFDSGRNFFDCQVAGVKRLMAQTSAHWWIENRSTRWNVLARQFATEISKESGVVDAGPTAEEAQAEATVRPETPVTETVAEIRATGKSVEIVFPEKREDFWKIIKKQLGYSWTGSLWKKTLGSASTGPFDQAAEAGNTLLSAGFVIRIFDDKTRAAAVSGGFIRDNGRWIVKRTAGDYAGWFAITWSEDSRSLYAAARKLTGSQWSKPSVVVPPEHFDLVLDFADMYEFNLSSGAQELVAKAEAAKDAAMTASVSPPEDNLRPEPGRKPAQLKIPAQVDIADEFKD